MDELDANRSLRYLNMSWNQINGPNAKLNKEINTKFSNFLSENQNLIHLDLNSVNLDIEVLRTISMSKSLLGFHFCGNNLTPKQFRRLRRWLKISNDEDDTLPIILEDENNGNTDMLDSGNAIKRKDTNQNISSLLNGIKTKSVKRDITVKGQCSSSDSYFQDKFVATRIIGHKEITPGLDEWRETDDCWL